MRDPQRVVAVQAECATLEVPEDWEHPGKKIGLALARLPATGGKPALDPLVLVPGGPGQGAIESFAMVVGALGELNRKRDIILMDPRGTGGSNRLTCDVKEESAKAIIACKDKLAGDPRHYHTTYEVRDLEAVRAALSIERWNLYGGSYGTRVALEYVKRYPDALRSVVLDGVVPHDLILGSTMQRTAEAALHRLEARSYPGLVDKLIRMKTAELTKIVRMALYAAELSALIPLAAKEPQRFTHLTVLVEASFGSINPISSFTVLCREDIPFMKELPPATPFFDNGIAKLMQEVCAEWPADKGEPRTPVSSAKPMLLLSGELDPVTPPEFGEQALKTLSNARHFIVPGTGHITMTRGCVPHLLALFLDDAQPMKLDPACLVSLAAFPVFTNANGP